MNLFETFQPTVIQGNVKQTSKRSESDMGEKELEGERERERERE